MLKTLESHNEPIKLVQITDCHLEEQFGGDLLGMDTDFSLRQVLDLLKQERSDNQLVLATGDISNRGAVAAYQRFKQAVSDLSIPYLWVKGNHDILANMESVVGSDETLHKIVHIGRWQIILLNSTIDGEVGGHLPDNELTFLANTLSQYSDRPTLIFMHHHLVPIGSKWLDQQLVDNAQLFFQIIDQHDTVKGVICGHVHQEFNQQRNHVALYSSPSTCIQFKPKSDKFCLDKKMPGYRWFELNLNGTFNTGVVRVPEQDFNVDFNATKGY